MTEPRPRRLREVATFEKGKPAKGPYFGQDAQPYLTPDYLRRISSAELVQRTVNAVPVSEGDTIVLWDGSNAGEVMKGRRGILASTMVRVSHGDDFDRDYFFYALKRCEAFLKGQTSGSGIPHLDKEIFRNLEILEFPEKEQRTIAHILSILDRGVERTRTLISKELRIQEGLMQALLSRGIDEDGRIRSLETHEFNKSCLGRIPTEWHSRKLRELTDEPITYGIVQAGPHIEDGVPYVRTGDMAGDAINPGSLPRTSSKIAASYKRSTVFAGDIVFALRATVGKVLPVSRELDGANLTQGTAKISPDSTMDSAFLLWALRSAEVQGRIRLQQKGTTFAEITLGDLREIEIAVPQNREEQERIAEILDGIHAEVLAQRRLLLKLARIEAGLMHDLLTGRRRIPPAMQVSVANRNEWPEGIDET